jgi:hypothetical protein
VKHCTPPMAPVADVQTGLIADQIADTIRIGRRHRT